MNLPFTLTSAHVTLLLTGISATINTVTLLFVRAQLRQNHKLERASFIHTLNNEFNQFSDIRTFLKTFDGKKSKLSEVKIETYERVLDYFTSFENLRWMINLKVLSTKEAKDYFGGRFYEAFNSSFFQSKCKEDDTFKLMYRMMFELHGNFEKTDLTIGYAKTIATKKSKK